MDEPKIEVTDFDAAPAAPGTAPANQPPLPEEKRGPGRPPLEMTPEERAEHDRKLEEAKNERRRQATQTRRIEQETARGRTTEIDPAILADRTAGDFPEISPDGERMDSMVDPLPEDGGGAFKAVERDNKGVEFNSERHKTDENGVPLKDENGNFRRRNRRRDPETGAEEIVRDQFEILAHDIVVPTQIQIMGAIWDAEEAQPDPAFRDTLVKGYANYFRSQNISLNSPGWQLLALNGAYILAVISKPKSKEKTKNFIGKAVGWIKGKFKRKNG